MMIGQKIVDEFGFRGREIVSDDMDLASERLGGPHVGECRRASFSACTPRVHQSGETTCPHPVCVEKSVVVPDSVASSSRKRRKKILGMPSW